MTNVAFGAKGVRLPAARTPIWISLLRSCLTTACSSPRTPPVYSSHLILPFDSLWTISASRASGTACTEPGGVEQAMRTVMLLYSLACETPPRTIPKDNSANIRAFFMSHSFIKDCWNLVHARSAWRGPLEMLSLRAQTG